MTYDEFKRRAVQHLVPWGVEVLLPPQAHRLKVRGEYVGLNGQTVWQTKTKAKQALRRQLSCMSIRPGFQAVRPERSWVTRFIEEGISQGFLEFVPWGKE